MIDWAGKVSEVVVVILGGGRGTRLGPLTLARSKPAVPIAGKYRLIDIPISNALHSGMDRIFLLTQFNTASLHRHIVRTYKFDTFSRGFVQILAAQQTPAGERWYQGTADAVRQNLGIIRELRGDLVLILSGDHLYRMDYGQMVKDHLENQADITLAVLPCTEEEIAGFGAVRIDPTGRVVEFREKPQNEEERSGMEVSPELLETKGLAADRPYLASMGVYLFRKDFLEECLENDLHDFGKHILPAQVDSSRVQSHFFPGYWRDIGTIGAFFEAHMDMVRHEPPFNFYDPDWPFYTHPRYLPGARIHDVRLSRTVLAEGCRLSESEIERSIIGVRTIMHQAAVRRSLVMGADEYLIPGPPGAPPMGIGAGSVIEDAIIDKNARIGKNVRITNENNVQDANGDGWVIRDGIVVVTKDGVIPDDTVI
jgi:glucose-1-phosphate adenylyltransferase